MQGQKRTQWPSAGLPGYGGRHGLAHDDDQRPRRARLGRGWNRGRSGHARSAHVDADSAGGRLPAPRTTPEGATATDLVLTVTEMLRRRGVVGKFVEFYGEGLASLSLADRATIANMAPEYGATCGIFPVDAETLRYLRFSGRPEEQVRLVEAYTKEQGLFHTAGTPAARYTDHLELDLGSVEPCLAGPKRPQDRVALGQVKENFADALHDFLSKAKPKHAPSPQPSPRRRGAAAGVNPAARFFPASRRGAG